MMGLIQMQFKKRKKRKFSIISIFYITNKSINLILNIHNKISNQVNKFSLINELFGISSWAINQHHRNSHL